MEYLYSDEPIVACSSGNTSNCAIAVIRLSGFKSFDFFSHLLSLDTGNIKVRHAYYCDIISNGRMIDQVVAVYFKGPASYNGENILELSVHGNILNVERIISLFIEAGFRHAHPGEFSYRALRNKKLNLSQVEGLDLLLNASSNFALDQGFSLMNGRLQDSYLKLHKAFVDHRSSIEFSMDFLEDMGEEQADFYLRKTLGELNEIVSQLYHRVNNDSGRLLNPEIALLGQPNSGKSTLFNYLVKEERSIVTDIAGTTRDYISENIRIDDVSYRLIDTAGLRTSEDTIEMEGVKRSLEIGSKSFIKILLVNPFSFSQEYFEFIKHVEFDLIIYTHCDLSGFDKKMLELRSRKYFGAFLHSLKLAKSGPMGAEITGPMGAKKTGPMGAEKSGPMGAEKSGPMGAEKSGPMGAEKIGPMGAEKSGPMGAEKSGPMGAEKTGPMGAEKTGPMGAEKIGSIGAHQKSDLFDFEISLSLKGLGENELSKHLYSYINKKYLASIGQEPILLERHKQKIFETHNLLKSYKELLENESDISIISSELNTIGHCISELIGIISPDDVLHNIFDNFCIGK